MFHSVYICNRLLRNWCETQKTKQEPNCHRKR